MLIFPNKYSRTCFIWIKTFSAFSWNYGDTLLPLNKLLIPCISIQTWLWLIWKYNRLPDYFIITFFCYATVSPSRWVNNYRSLTGKQCPMLPAVIWTLVLANDVLITMAHRWQQIEPLRGGTTLTEKIRKDPLLFFSSDYWRPKSANIPTMWKMRFFLS